ALGFVFAADGNAVHRRGADGNYAPETLPASLVLPSLVASDGSVLYAAGIGAAQFSGGQWVSLPPAPSNSGGSSGLARAAVVIGGQLALGFGDGSTTFYTGSLWTLP